MAADPTTGGRLTAPDAVAAARAARLLREQQTKARYQDVVAGAQARIAEQSGDPRIAPPAGATRNRGIDRGLVEATGVPQLARDAYWSVTHPVDRLLGRGRAAEQSMVIPFGPFRSGAIPKPKAPKPEPVFPVEGAEAVIDVTKKAKGPIPGPAGFEPGLVRQQEKLYSTERARRAEAGGKALQEGSGDEAFQAALRELKGELPKLRVAGIRENLSDDTVVGLLNHVRDHDGLRFYEKIRTRTALIRVLDGTVPTRSQVRLLETAFGPETAEDLIANIPLMRKLGRAGIELINVPRALRSSFDLSAPFRQGLVLGARHPRMFAREFKPMVKAFKSERAYDEVMEDIVSRPTFETMDRAGLALTDLENLSTREEAFIGANFAERIPVVGRGVRASGRAYTAFLNKFRADAFDNYLQLAESQGLDVKDPELLKSIARWVNHATGRGTMKHLEGAMVPLNALFFSPRLIASRLNLLNPRFYADLDPFARKQALQGMGQLLGGISLTLWLAKLAGADVGVDPRSSDFAKIKVGDTRVDIAGGFQQYIVAATRIVKGEVVSSTTGKLEQLDGGFGKPSRNDIAIRFVKGKFAPVPAAVATIGEGKTGAGEDVDPVKEIGRTFLPLGVENAIEGFGSSPEAGAASTVLGSIGFGVQTYESKQAKEAREARKQIGRMVREKKLTKSAADVLLKRLDEAAELAKLPPRQRTLVSAVSQGLPLDRLNQLVEEPYTQDEYDDAEMDVLEQRAVGR